MRRSRWLQNHGRQLYISGYLKGGWFTYVPAFTVDASVSGLRAASDESRAGSARLKAVSWIIATMVNRLKGRILTQIVLRRVGAWVSAVGAEDENNWQFEPEASYLFFTHLSLPTNIITIQSLAGYKHELDSVGNIATVSASVLPPPCFCLCASASAFQTYPSTDLCFLAQQSSLNAG